MSNATKINEVRSLRDFAANLRGATQRWTDKYSDTRHYDKQGFGFVIASDRSMAFRVPTLAFEAYVGTYGSSSVGTAWQVNQDLVNRLLPKALNVHKQAIFDTMAALAEDEARGKLDEARAEMAALQTMLDSVAEPISSVAVASA